MLLQIDDVSFVRGNETCDIMDQSRAVRAVDEECGSVAHVKLRIG